MGQEHRAEAAAVDKKFLLVFFLGVFFTASHAQDIPQDELQVNLNSYFDNWSINIVYPTVSYTRRMTDSSSINVRYLVDVISAASMKSHFTVDGVTSATEKEDGGGDSTPDEIRHEFAAGVTQGVSGGIFSVNGLFSKEHDYRSFTFAASYSHPFASKNTVLQMGLVRSWDKVFPQIRDWKKDKDVYTGSLSVTQILGKRLIAQFVSSYSHEHGFLSDAYQVIHIIQPEDQLLTLEPVHPGTRRRKAVAARMNLKIDRSAALHLGARYYWDDWDVQSLTSSISFQQHFNDALTIQLGFRNYLQSRAFFFKDTYEAPEAYMTVDSKLDKGYTNEYQFDMILNGGPGRFLPFLRDERTQLNFKFNFYQRQTDAPNWHSRTKELYAYITSLGFRYRF